MTALRWLAARLLWPLVVRLGQAIDIDDDTDEENE